MRLFTGVNLPKSSWRRLAPRCWNAGGFYVSLNAGSSNYAGKACNLNYFAVAFRTTSYADTAGIAANELGVKRGGDGAQLPGRPRRRGGFRVRTRGTPLKRRQ